MIFYVVKKNRIYFFGTLNIGLKHKNDYTDNLPTAKFFDNKEEAEKVADRLNKENACDFVRGSWKVKQIRIEEI